MAEAVFVIAFWGGRTAPGNDGSGNTASRNNNSANNALGNNISINHVSINHASDNYVSGNQNTLINDTDILSDNNAHIYQPRSLKFGFVLTFLILSMAYFGFDLWLNQLEAPLTEQLKSSIDTVSQQALVRQ